ncbi:unnamed protein product [Echinostoma caproni]|uniref:Uncharacterized protein n=1 Tax=Echinostoma caproni TaxID=27848 RepID=A0A183B654_9TREM|nr:unnamed protein product [Echinostoma caproni]
METTGRCGCASRGDQQVTLNRIRIPKRQQNERSSKFLRFGWFGPAKGLRSTPTMDDLAPAMVEERGCIHRLDYVRPHENHTPCLTYNVL